MIKSIRRLRSKKKKYTLRDVHFILPPIFNLRRGRNHHQSVAMIKFTMIKWTHLIKNKTDAITFLIVERALLLRQIFVRGYTVYKRKKKEEEEEEACSWNRELSRCSRSVQISSRFDPFTVPRTLDSTWISCVYTHVRLALGQFHPTPANS